MGVMVTVHQYLQIWIQCMLINMQNCNFCDSRVSNGLLCMVVCRLLCGMSLKARHIAMLAMPQMKSTNHVTYAVVKLFKIGRFFDIINTIYIIVHYKPYIELYAQSYKHLKSQESDHMQPMICLTM